MLITAFYHIILQPLFANLGDFQEKLFFKFPVYNLVFGTQQRFS